MFPSSKEKAWRVTKDDLKRNEDYEEYLEMNEEMFKNTDTENAPWTSVVVLIPLYNLSDPMISSNPL